MKATKPAAANFSEIDGELQEAIRQAISGVHLEEMRKACERMDRMREEVYNREGILDIGVPPFASFGENFRTHEKRLTSVEANIGDLLQPAKPIRERSPLHLVGQIGRVLQDACFQHLPYLRSHFRFDGGTDEKGMRFKVLQAKGFTNAC
jgi:hypothetical protein